MKQFPPPPLPPLPPVEPEMVMVSEVPKNPRASVAVTVALPLSTPVTIPLLFTVKTEVLLLAQMYGEVPPEAVKVTLSAGSSEVLEEVTVISFT